MDPQHFYGKKHKMSTRPRVVTVVPDTSEDEDISDDDDYRIPKPLESVYLPESEVSSSDTDSGAEEHVMRNQPSSSSSSTVKKTKKDKAVWTDEGIHYNESSNVFLGCESLPDEIMRLETPMDFCLN